jgi:hypothetical protein
MYKIVKELTYMTSIFKDDLFIFITNIIFNYQNFDCRLLEFNIND